MTQYHIGRANQNPPGYENELLATENGAHGEKRA
jgi:hypothetical protein